MSSVYQVPGRRSTIDTSRCSGTTFEDNRIQSEESDSRWIIWFDPTADEEREEEDVSLDEDEEDLILYWMENVLIGHPIDFQAIKLILAAVELLEMN